MGMLNPKANDLHAMTYPYKNLSRQGLPAARVVGTSTGCYHVTGRPNGRFNRVL